MKTPKKEYFYKLGQSIIPPIILDILKKSRVYPAFKKTLNLFVGYEYRPQWNRVNGGSLAGRELFFDPQGPWQEMLSGEYDQPMFDYTSKLDLAGKTIFDVGMHIGFHSLNFAHYVGKEGRVVSFEPNRFNVERFKMILTHNQDLAERITVCETAVSNGIGVEKFIFSDNIEAGTSSGSFIDSADTFFSKETYQAYGFQETEIKTLKLDSLEIETGITSKPALIKIDVEGAECFVLEGAEDLLLRCRPIILLEVHSILNMFKVTTQLSRLNYSLLILDQNKDGRCFLAAEPQ